MVWLTNFSVFFPNIMCCRIFLAPFDCSSKRHTEFKTNKLHFNTSQTGFFLICIADVERRPYFYQFSMTLAVGISVCHKVCWWHFRNSKMPFMENMFEQSDDKLLISGKFILNAKPKWSIGFHVKRFVRVTCFTRMENIIFSIDKIATTTKFANWIKYNWWKLV